MQESSQNIKQQKKEEDNEQNRNKRFKYCCRKCKHTQKGKKSCVCVVPLSQRRTSLGGVGCQTCGCKGCSIEDYISRGEDPEYRPDIKQKDKKQEKQKSIKFDGKNGCCRKCMKAFSKTGKSCLCQVPKNVRKGRLTSDGCTICGCKGCNPKDKDSSDSSSSSKRSWSESVDSSSESRSYNQSEYNFNNMDKSAIGKIIIVEYSLFPGMLGMGIPQRTSSYILGKPQ